MQLGKRQETSTEGGKEEKACMTSSLLRPWGLCELPTVAPFKAKYRCGWYFPGVAAARRFSPLRKEEAFIAHQEGATTLRKKARVTN